MKSKWLQYVGKVALVSLALFIFSLAIKALLHLTRTVKFSDVMTAISNIPTLHLIAAFLVVAFGYLLLTLYDFIALRHIQKNQPLDRQVHYGTVALTSFTAYAISHTVGANVLTASGIRYRFYTLAGLTKKQIANIVWLVSMAFTFGISTLVGISLTISPNITLRLLSNLDKSIGIFENAIYTQGLGVFILTVISCLILWAGKDGKHINIKGWRFDLPPAIVLIQQIAISIFDLSTVALVMWLLMPPSVHVSYLSTFSAFIQSMTMGILSHVPGGLGVFEVTMLAAFPRIDKAEMLGMLLIFRIYYYILPFLFALLTFFGHEIHQYSVNKRQKPAPLPPE